MSPPRTTTTGGGTSVLALSAALVVGFALALSMQRFLWRPGMVNQAELISKPAPSRTTATSGGLVAQTSRKRAAPGPNGYLIIGEFDFYRFTNNKIQLIEALAMAEQTGRTLVAPRFFKCKEQSLSLLFDMDALSSHVDVIEDPDWSLDLKHFCGTGKKSGQPPNLYIKYESFTQSAMNKNTAPLPSPTMDWRGVQWETYTQKTLPLSGSVALPMEQGAGPRHLRTPWAEWWPHTCIDNYLPMFMADPLFVHKLQASPAVKASKCIVVEETFLSVDWSQHPTSVWTNATAAVVGSPTIMRQVALWQEANGLVPGQYVAAHVRMTDMKGQRHTSERCSSDKGLVAGFLKELRKKHAIPDDMPLALASEDFKDPCVVAVQESATRTVLVDLRGMTGPTSGCINSIFIQETLAQSAVYLGIAKSTFSASIDWIRRLRYGYDPSTSLLI